MGQNESTETNETENITDHDYLLRFSVIGEYGTGKTSLINRFTYNTFPYVDYKTTSKGYGIFLRNISVDGKIIKVVIRDTFGDESYRTLGNEFYARISGFLVVYDATNQRSFDRVDFWIKEIKEKAKQDVPIVLIGNRCDLQSKKVVTFTEAKEKAEAFGIPVIETSACTDKNVEQAFLSLVVKCIQNAKDLQLQSSANTMVSLQSFRQLLE